MNDIHLNRRQFNRGLLLTALTGLVSRLDAATPTMTDKLANHFGALVPDPKGILDLPPGFSYKVISKLDQVMSDGRLVPDRADGMGAFALDEDRVVLVRNHEIHPKSKYQQPEDINKAQADMSYDLDGQGLPLHGGTSTLIYNLKTQKVENQYMSLLGTIRNCAGGITPWGSWLSCEESVDKASARNQKDHGFVFEVPANHEGLVDPEPLKAMGRFNHEAACVDPNTGYVYMTEDRNDSVLYRFIPNQIGKLTAGGKLQAMVVEDQPKFDTRNWDTNSMLRDTEYGCTWVDLDNVESPDDDLRHQAYEKGAARFARGEGVWFGDNELFFCCTSGGAKKLGQIMRLSFANGKTTLSLFLESQSKAEFNFGDNLTIAPNGHLVVCEDQYSDTVNNHLKGVTPEGQTYDIGKVRWQTEPAGACFSPDGSTLFVNLYSPTATLAITGPWI
jgi:secreted PhoX family phosphatase